MYVGRDPEQGTNEVCSSRKVFADFYRVPLETMPIYRAFFHLFLNYHVFVRASTCNYYHRHPFIVSSARPLAYTSLRTLQPFIGRRSKHGLLLTENLRVSSTGTLTYHTHRIPLSISVRSCAEILVLFCRASSKSQYKRVVYSIGTR